MHSTLTEIYDRDDEKINNPENLRGRWYILGDIDAHNEVHDPLTCQDFRLCIQDISLELVTCNLGL